MGLVKQLYSILSSDEPNENSKLTNCRNWTKKYYKNKNNGADDYLAESRPAGELRAPNIPKTKISLKIRMTSVDTNLNGKYEKKTRPPDPRTTARVSRE